ncbi:MAG: hypothetical protein ACLP8S_06135 [Solirubrobacteraceae bacterium]
MVQRDEDCVLVLGLGDLGQRIVNALAHRPGGRLVTVARDVEFARSVAGQASLIAALCDGPGTVEAARIDLDEPDATATELARLRPSVIVLAASRLTWWRLPERAASVPYGAWLPFHVTLVRKLMQARAAAGVDAPVVALPYPDGVGPILAGAGLAPELGAGNVLEMAAKLMTVAAARANVPREKVNVRLVAHHAVQRMAFSAFKALGGNGPPSPPPFLAKVLIDGEPLPDAIVRDYLTAPYPFPSGRATHRLTAAATAATVDALLSRTPRKLHVPAPAGRPGGYPVTVSRAGIELDLPDGLSETDAIAINAVAARWDGIEMIAPDGTLTFTAAVSNEIERMLGLRIKRITLDEQQTVADELVARLNR